MTDRPDRELDDDLAGHSALSARYRAASCETTTPELDAAILAQARNAVRPPVVLAPVRAQPSRPSRLPWQQRWAVPVGIAATLLIGVDLAWRVGDRVRDQTRMELPQRVRLDEGVTVARPAPPAPAPAVAAVSQPAEPGLDRAQEAVPERVPTPPASDPEGTAAGTAAGIDVEPPAPSTLAAAPVETAQQDAGPAAVENSVSAQADAAADVASAQQESAVQRAQRTQSLPAEALRPSPRSSERLAYAPAPVLAAKAAEAPPSPRRDVEAAQRAAADLLELLRAADLDTLVSRYAAPQLTRQSVQEASAVLSDELTQRLREDADGTWRADFIDARQRLRGTLRMAPRGEGWQLVGLVTRQP
ncbi:hypothetical protein [Methylibium sp.]|uniref:hypothetical protein n=1 Tax=Methylibium sp. TaxID=2067992 RepID=UPI003340BE59